MTAKTGRGRARGERHGSRKFDDSEIFIVRHVYKFGAWSHRELAKIFHVSSTAIGKIVRRETWRHL